MGSSRACRTAGSKGETTEFSASVAIQKEGVVYKMYKMVQ